MKPGNRTGRRMWQLAFALYLAILLLIIAMAYQGIVPTELAFFPHYDTVGHLVLLGIASFLLHRALDRRKAHLGGISLPLAPLLISLAAVAEEALQTFSPIRTFSCVDCAANFVGIWGAYLLDQIAS